MAKVYILSTWPGSPWPPSSTPGRCSRYGAPPDTENHSTNSCPVDRDSSCPLLPPRHIWLFQCPDPQITLQTGIIAPPHQLALQHFGARLLPAMPTTPLPLRRRVQNPHGLGPQIFEAILLHVRKYSALYEVCQGFICERMEQSQEACRMRPPYRQNRSGRRRLLPHSGVQALKSPRL
jgi:hypothetical protein